MREEANAPNRARVGRGWIRRACLPRGRARGHLGRDWLGRTRRRRDRRHVGGCGRGRVVAGHDLTGRPRGAPPTRRSPDGRRLLSHGRDSGELAVDPMRPPRAALGDVGTECIRARALQPWTVRFGALMARPCPKSCANRARRASCAHSFNGWPEQPLWINAVALRPADAPRSGGRASRDVPTAVAASCAIPAFFAPVSIDGSAMSTVACTRRMPILSRIWGRPRGDQFAHVHCTRRLTHRARSTRATTGSLRVGARGRAGPSRRNSGAQVPADRFRPRRDGHECDGRLAFVCCHECGSRVGASTARASGRPSPNGDPHEFDALSFSSSRIPASTPEQRTAMSGAVS